MSLDFPTLLVVATAVTGAIWAADAAWWAPARRARAEEAAMAGGDAGTVERLRRQPTVVEYARSFFPVILAVLVLRSFVVEPFRIPSGSMMPTLVTGDFILVNKYTYGLRLPVLHTEIADFGDPGRGDVMVFRYPEDPSVDYIKRVVGVPGDTIEYRDRHLYINGEAVEMDYQGRYDEGGAGSAMTGARIYREQYGEGLDHEILLEEIGNNREVRTRVPEGHYFVMGDNRDNSRDSRYWGFVPDDHVVGRAFLIWMNWDSVEGSVRLERIGGGIR
jgi:signal peptidase I